MATVNLADRMVNTLISAPSPGPEARRTPQTSPVQRLVRRVLSVVVGLLIWELIGSHYPYSMSSAVGVVRAVRHYLVPQVLPAAYESLKTFSLAFAICVVFGIPIGLAMARIKFVRVAIQPYVTMLNSMPMLALFPLLILVFGINAQIRVAACVLFGIWSVIVNTFTGASRVDVTLEDVGRTFVASGWKRLTTIIIPGSLDYIFAGVRIGFGHAMIGAVVIELEASFVGVGSLLQRYSQNLQLAPYFIVVLVLGIFSITFSMLLKRLQKWATYPGSEPSVVRRRTRPRRPEGLAPPVPIWCWAGIASYVSPFDRRARSSAPRIAGSLRARVSSLAALPRGSSRRDFRGI